MVEQREQRGDGAGAAVQAARGQTELVQQQSAASSVSSVGMALVLRCRQPGGMEWGACGEGYKTMPLSSQLSSVGMALVLRCRQPGADKVSSAAVSSEQVSSVGMAQVLRGDRAIG